MIKTVRLFLHPHFTPTPNSYQKESQNDRLDVLKRIFRQQSLESQLNCTPVADNSSFDSSFVWIESVTTPVFLFLRLNLGYLDQAPKPSCQIVASAVECYHRSWLPPLMSDEA